MAIINTSLTSIETPIFTSPSGTQNAITTMIFCNTADTSTAYTSLLNVFLMSLGGNASPATQILKEVEIPPGETFMFDTEKIILDSGESIHAQDINASTNPTDPVYLTATLSYINTQ